jgi:hypothetical protein
VGYSGREVDQLFGLEKSDVESVSYTDAFEKACPIFMSYGLSYDDFWHGDPFKAKYQLKTYQLNIRHEDELMWEQGMYIYEAILQCSPILHPFSKATNPLPYTEKPHLVQLEDKENEEKKQQEIENERLKAQIWIQNVARLLQKKFNNEENKE